MSNRVELNHNQSLYRGVGLPFEAASSEIGRIVSLLFSRPSREATVGLCSWRNINNVFGTTSQEYLEAFQVELQRVLLYAFEHRENVHDELFALFVYQTLSLLPFAYPQEGFAVRVPVHIEGEWVLKTYRIDRKFELASQLLVSPMPAYGFTSSDGGPPLLVFMGTTYPAGEGFLGTLFSDFTPFSSVGSLPFFCARRAIGEWLEENEGAYAMGISLGGALSLHAARTFGERIAKVYAYVPPGVYPHERRAFENSATQIHLLFQEGDPVSKMGFFPEGENVKLYHVYEDERTNGLSAHARVFLSGPSIRVVRGAPEVENQRHIRKILTGLHMIFSPLLFVLMLPIYLLVSFVKLIKKGALSLRTRALFHLRTGD